MFHVGLYRGEADLRAEAQASGEERSKSGCGYLAIRSEATKLRKICSGKVDLRAEPPALSAEDFTDGATA